MGVVQGSTQPGGSTHSPASRFVLPLRLVSTLPSGVESIWIQRTWDGCAIFSAVGEVTTRGCNFSEICLLGEASVGVLEGGSQPSRQGLYLEPA